jgi:tRNA(adenine34) deaminase
MNIEAWMHRAYELAEQAACEDEVPVGAVLVHQNSILSVGYNQRERRQDPLAHAEILALQEASRRLQTWRLLETTLVVTLEPCLMCLAACQQARISRLIYGACDPKGGALSLGYAFHENAKLHHRFQVKYVPYPPGSQILSDFFAKKRKNGLFQRT